MNDHQSSALKHVTGPIFLGVMALLYNTLATRRKHPTISSGVRWIANREMGAEAVGAIVGMLLFHWFWKIPEGNK